MAATAPPPIDPDAAAVINRIRRGDLPIKPFWDAVRSILQDGAAALEWSVDLAEVGGAERRVTADTLTLAEQVSIVEAAGVGWEAFDPITDPRHALALLEACAVPNAGSVTSEQFDKAYTRDSEEVRPADPS